MSPSALTAVRAGLPAASGWLLAAVCFALPTHVAPVYVLSFFLLVSLLLQPALRARIGEVVASPTAWAFVAYYGVFALSMLWTADTEWGARMVGRQTPFLLFPLFWAAARDADRRHCISAFLAAIALCVLLAHYNWLQLNIFTDWPAGVRVDKSPDDTAPFVDRIMYTPLLAFGGYFVGHRLLFEVTTRGWRTAYLVLLAGIVVNLVFSGGRAGMLGFLALIFLLIMQRLAHRPMRAALVGVAAVGALLGGAYIGNDSFRSRFDMAVNELRDPAANINTSVGLRITFSLNSWRLFTENPWLGVGVGDYTDEYTAINRRFSPESITTFNPHNQYMWILATTGALGGAAFIALIASMVRGWRWRDRNARHFLAALWMGFGVICLVESYLWRSNTALFFVVMSALLLAPSRPYAR